MITQKDFFGNEQIIEPVTLDDIPVHFELMKEHVIHQPRQLENLKMCVEAGTAYKIGNEAFLYYWHYAERVADGYGIYGGAQLATLLIGVFHQADPETFCIRFGPQFKPDWYRNYRSMMTKHSLPYRSPLVLRLDELFKRWEKITRAKTWES